jgi:hypothetical protein
MSWEPVRSGADLLTLDADEIVEGFHDGLEDAPEPQPGGNRSRSYWHGWRVGMMDLGKLEIDDAHRALVHDIAPGGVFKREFLRSFVLIELANR